ncbi:family 20 glycosylhydrolase [Microbacterium sp. ARD32]|uniref:family 20 glycosylhydrolase n=1 Tax=Microbacterium sp. ARD32 TaxID=2962577 RepID=UPI00288185B6|nr:family 20 glycosylhydrolase [Microbacterium sp. ARD32]MDT0157795.1 family 20 glycosylhydrolase [Microbacterium sp. ARD32]
MSPQLLPEVGVGPVPGRSSRFEWRGLLIDSARTRYPVPVLKRVVELASRYGFNRLHWHLTDDQGWRFEVPEYPLLTAQAAHLPRGRFDDYDSLAGDSRERALAEQDERWTNGFYTDDEIAELVAHADEHGILIVPEVDVPGHMTAAIGAYPGLGRPAGLSLPGGSMREHMWWPARDDLLWPTDEARDFVQAIMRRVAELFPGPYVHIGGDECAFQQWASDPRIGEWMRLRGASEVKQLQGWFMDVAAQTLRKSGKQVAVWDEACDLWDDPDALVIAWDEARGMERIARASQRFVLADARTLYLNRVDPDAVPAQKGMIPGITVCDILTADWPELRDERCIGIQAGVWSEFVLDGDDLLSMLFPRLLAVAERLWSSEVDATVSAERVAREYAALREAGVLRDV